MPRGRKDGAGVPPSGSGSRASHGAAKASPPEASIPNADEPTIICPHCQEGLHVAARSVVDNDQRLTWSIHPKHGDMLQAKTVGGTLEQIDKLLRMCAKEDGGSVRCYVERAYTDDDGSVHFDLAVLPVVTRKSASAIEARRAATPQSDAVHESVVATGETPTPTPSSSADQQ